MDPEDIKQIIIGYYAIESAIGAILKPIRIELSDSETVATMPKGGKATLECIRWDCEAIQKVLNRIHDNLFDMEKDLCADEEIAEAVEMITGILYDNYKPIGKTASDSKTNLVNMSKSVLGIN